MISFKKGAFEMKERMECGEKVRQLADAPFVHNKPFIVK